MLPSVLQWAFRPVDACEARSGKYDVENVVAACPGVDGEWDSPMALTPIKRIRRRVLITASFGIGLAIALTALREPTEPLTLDRLAAARQVWRNGAPASYDLRYRMHDSQYAISVRRGSVTELTVNGRIPPTIDSASYTMEGLFDTLEQELSNLNDPAGPFAGHPGKVSVRVRFHSQWGYIERYVRGSAGPIRGTVIEVQEFKLVD